MFLNKNSANNYFVLELPPTGFLNAKIVLEARGSKKMYKENVQDSFGRIMFGLRDMDVIKEVRVYTLDNHVYVLKNPKINSVVKLIKPE